MARMPDETQISQSQIGPSRAVRRAPRDFISGAVANLGQTITREADLDRDLSLQLKRKGKAEGDALDQARADADWGTRLATEQSQYDLEKKPKYNVWGEEIDKNLPKHKAASASLIRDPKLRELWNIRREDDVVRTSLGIKEKAQTLDSNKRRAEGLQAVNTMLQTATRPGIDQKESDKIIATARTSLDNLAMAGVLTPEQVVEARQNFAKKYASLRVSQDLENNPGETARHLRGGAAGDSYYARLRKQENASGSDTARPLGKDGKPTSTALGRYQFLEGTWNQVRREHPELALTADGRTDPGQQERAIRVFTADNGRRLGEAGLPSSEANLYLAHFMGADGAIKALKADPGATAAALFPESASANKTIFYTQDGAPRTVAEVIALQTKGFSGQNGPAPEYYDVLDSDDRLRLASAAEGEFARREKESADATALDRYAMAQTVDNDLAQIASTGQSTDLSIEQVKTSLGDDGAAKWIDERQTAVETYKATSVIEAMDSSQIAEHLETLEPKAGDANFERAKKVFDAAEDRAAKLQKLRVDDPANSVTDSPLVKKAMENFDGQPASVQRLVGARLASQAIVKIPAATQQPITKSEARKIIAPITSIMDMMDATAIAAMGEGKGDGAARRQAAKDAQKNAEMQIRETIELVEQTYGPYAQRVLAFAIAESYKDKDVGNIAARVQMKIAKGIKPTTSDMSAVEAVNEASIAEKAITGTLPAPQNNYGTKPSADVSRSLGKTFVQMGAKGFPTPGPKSIDNLKANPQTAADFEKVFGAGSAAQWLPRN